MSLPLYNGYETKQMEKNALYTYAVRLPRGLMTPLFVKTTLRVKWVNLLMNCSFSIWLILIDNGVNQEVTNWNSLVQLTSERSNLSWCMPAKRRLPISVLGVLTIDGWNQRQKEFRNLYQTQTIGDISWMSFRRNRQAGHRMTISRENVWGTCMRNYSVSVINDGDSIKSFCSKYNVDEKHAEQTYKDFKWDVTLIESGKIEKLKVKQLDFYLKEHGLTTIGRKLDKVKAIRCHY